MRYEVVFRGKLVADCDEETALANLARLFRTEKDRLRPLFSGKRTVLKRDLDRETAEKYRQALRKAGAVVAIVKIRDEEPAAADLPDDPAAPSAHESTGEAEAEADVGELDLAEPGVQIVPSERHPEPAIDVTSLSMAEVGATVDDSPPPEAPQIDTGNLEATDIDDALDSSERPSAPEFDLSHMEVAEAGATVDESPQPPPKEIDTSRLEAVEIDRPLDDTPRAKAPDLDLSQLKLDDSED